MSLIKKLYATTTDATPTTIFSYNSAPVVSFLLKINYTAIGINSNDSLYGEFIYGFYQDTIGNIAAVDAGINTGGNNFALPAPAISCSLDTVNQKANVVITGKAGDTIKWGIEIEIVETSYV